MKKALKWVIWAVVAAIFSGTFIYLYKNSKGHETRYEVVRPSVADLSRSTLLTGSIEPRSRRYRESYPRSWWKPVIMSRKAMS